LGKALPTIRPAAAAYGGQMTNVTIYHNPN
jgi:hypothetical protein